MENILSTIKSDYRQYEKECMALIYEWESKRHKMDKEYPVGNHRLKVFCQGDKIAFSAYLNDDVSSIAYTEGSRDDFEKVWKKFKRDLEKSRKEVLEYDGKFGGDKTAEDLGEFIKRLN